jgi:hypothetical protein
MFAGKSREYNGICDICGFKKKNYELRKRWDGYWVCNEDWESRHILDFYRTKNDTHTLPITRSDPVITTQYEYRRNNAIQTEDFTATSNWTVNQGTVTTQSIVNPNGVLQACSKLSETVGPAVTAWINNNNVATFNRNNAPWTNSIYVKPNGRIWIVGQQQMMDGTLATANFLLSGNGRIGSISNCYWANISSEANGWYRISFCYNGSLGASANSCTFYVADGDGDNTVVGDGVSGYYFWGFQQEQSLVPLSNSSVIPAVLNTVIGTRRTPSAYQPVLDTTAIPAPYPTPITTSDTWVPTLTGGSNQFCAGAVKINAKYLVTGSVLTFTVEFQCEPGGYMRFNGNNMVLPKPSVTAGTWRITSSEGGFTSPPGGIPSGFTGTIAAAASTMGPLNSGPSFFSNRVDVPVTLTITGSYGV